MVIMNIMIHHFSGVHKNTFREEGGFNLVVRKIDEY